ncbi:MAG: STAS domain-containing protein [Acidobacteria bacterium]|nr:STAS domain-containing protein [Acidobacteriota bacterium]
MLSVKCERAGDVAVVRCAGRIVRGQEAGLRNAVLEEKHARFVVLDLSEVESMDAGGLNLLVYLHRWTESNGAHLKVVDPRPFVREMLTRTRLNCVFDISSFHEALTVLRGGAEKRAERAEIYREALAS